MRNWKSWIKCAGIRALKTVAQAAIASIGVAAVLSDVNWIEVASAAVLAGLLFLFDVAQRRLDWLREKEPARKKEAEEPAPAETAARDVNPEVSGTLDEVNGIYSNSYMGLAFNGSGWVFYSEDSLPYTGSDAEPLEDDPDFIKNGNSIIAAFAADASEPSDIYLMVDTASVPFIRENGEDAYILELQKNFERWAEQLKCEDVSSERITRISAGSAELSA